MALPRRASWVILLILVGFAAAMSYGLWVWFKPARNVQNESAITATAAQLFSAYQTSEDAANKTYLDKAIEVSGTVKSVKTNDAGKTVISLDAGDEMFGVLCTLADVEPVQVGQPVRIKGVCTGFLMDVIIIDCKLIK